MSALAFVQDLRQVVEQANHSLTQTMFDHILRIFFERYQSGEHTPAELSGEFGRDEFLLVVDEEGRAGAATEALLSAFRSGFNAHSDLGNWFHEAMFHEEEQAGRPVVLAARWLCHVAGLRHGTVEIFLDPPGMDGFTLVQVRGMGKIEAPGAFDIPCAGHISGVDPADAALWKELAEELNLSKADLNDLRLLGRYNSYSRKANQAQYVNIEHRVLYRAQLIPTSAARIRFNDGEVAGLGLFTVSELRELVKRFPERVASGLSDAMGYYH